MPFAFMRELKGASKARVAWLSIACGEGVDFAGLL